MMRAIHDAGFTPVPDDVRLTLTGALEARDGRFYLALDRMKEPKVLVCAPAPTGDAIEQGLVKNAGKAVVIRGRWSFDWEGSVQVETVERTTTTP